MQNISSAASADRPYRLDILYATTKKSAETPAAMGGKALSINLLATL
jgi:hypothetical protein